MGAGPHLGPVGVPNAIRERWAHASPHPSRTTRPADLCSAQPVTRALWTAVVGQSPTDVGRGGRGFRASRSDLGSVTELWRQPQSYARFLDQELSLSLVYHGPLLVAMPGGFGYYDPRSPANPHPRPSRAFESEPGVPASPPPPSLRFSTSPLPPATRSRSHQPSDRTRRSLHRHRRSPRIRHRRRPDRPRLGCQRPGPAPANPGPKTRLCMIDTTSRLAVEPNRRVTLQVSLGIRLHRLGSPSHPAGSIVSHPATSARSPRPGNSAGRALARHGSGSRDFGHER
jgi:hypothetical protein